MLDQCERCLNNDKREDARRLLILSDIFNRKLTNNIRETKKEYIQDKLFTLFGEYLDRYLELPYE
jgi:hypothetical protein